MWEKYFCWSLCTLISTYMRYCHQQIRGHNNVVAVCIHISQPCIGNFHRTPHYRVKKGIAIFIISFSSMQVSYVFVLCLYIIRMLCENGIWNSLTLLPKPTLVLWYRIKEFKTIYNIRTECTPHSGTNV